MIIVTEPAALGKAICERLSASGNEVLGLARPKSRPLCDADL